MEVSSISALVLVGTAALVDIRQRRVPNPLTFGAAAIACVFHTWSSGWAGLAHSLGGWGIGLALFLPFFLLRGLGAGDVKLLAAVGAWLGPWGAARAALFSVFAGGVLAILVAVRSRYLKQAGRNIVAMLGFWRSEGLRPVPGVTIDDAGGPRLAYATAIAAGTLAAVWFAGQGGGLL